MIMIGSNSDNSVHLYIYDGKDNEGMYCRANLTKDTVKRERETIRQRTVLLGSFLLQTGSGRIITKRRETHGLTGYLWFFPRVNLFRLHGALNILTGMTLMPRLLPPSTAVTGTPVQ
jgi:hypothetical protein